MEEQNQKSQQSQPNLSFSPSTGLPDHFHLGVSNRFPRGSFLWRKMKVRKLEQTMESLNAGYAGLLEVLKEDLPRDEQLANNPMLRDLRELRNIIRDEINWLNRIPTVKTVEEYMEIER